MNIAKDINWEEVSDPRGRDPIYDWDAIFQRAKGQGTLLVPGTPEEVKKGKADYAVSPQSFKQQFWREARKRNIKAHVKTLGEGLAVKVETPPKKKKKTKKKR